jgi:SAM-dependent methyltransferase
MDLSRTGSLVLPALVAATFLLTGCGRSDDNGAAPPRDFDPARFVADTRSLDAPYVASDADVVTAMLALGQVGADDYVVDLGSGDGRILIAAARSFGARGLGVDIDGARIRESIANAAAAGVASRVTFRRQDLFETPLQDADVLTLYLTREVNLRLRPRILAEMRPGTRVVSENFDMGDWRADRRQRVGDTTLFLWVVPARVAGRWTLSVGHQDLPVEFVQHNQVLEGVIHLPQGEARVEQGWINGNQVRFVADLGGGVRSFEATLQGSRLVPRRSSDHWQADRVQ